MNKDKNKKLEYEELFNLFKHIDESAHKKETLFLGLSLAIVPAVFASWDKLNIYAVILAAIASITFYWLHGIHIARYSYTQEKICYEMNKLKSNFQGVFDVPHHLSIQKIRKQFKWVLVLFWCMLIALHELQNLK